MKNLLLSLAAAGTALSLLTGCGDPNVRRPAADGGGVKPKIVVSNYPLKYLTDRIGDTDVEVSYLVPKGEDPAFWEPSPADVTAMQNADLIVLNGATYEKWRDHVTLPDAKILDTSKSFANNYIQVTEGVTHSHGKEGEHSHSGTAFTTWIDFEQAQQQAKAIQVKLESMLPKAPEMVQARGYKLQQDLYILNKDMKAAADKIGQTPLLGSHPVYQYMARRYNLNMQSVHWEPKTVPSDDDIAALKKILETHPAKWMIWEGEPAPASVEKLKALGIESITFEPCGNVPDKDEVLMKDSQYSFMVKQDWLIVMRRNVTNMKSIQ